ncbi:eCIS core domain-containing protein [Deinococcus arcticus]|uniref:eCIS core domain-containing protein n=1 Tax=Deinococcus arcticus TaxID=2136176 RepID=UPI001304F82D|nr:DUF4157 domain-containing protein [Deinococcus arcticus]
MQRQLAELDAEATQPVLQRIQAKRGSGNPLPESIQRHLEQGLNHDLSRVRIHDDVEADTLARSVNALAFTTGSDIFFQSGKFNPNSQSGLELLAHEVTHTVQQSQGRVGPGVDPDAGLEAEARAMGARLAAPYRRVPVFTRLSTTASGSTSSALQRQAGPQLRQASANRNNVNPLANQPQTYTYFEMQPLNKGKPANLKFDHGFLQGKDGELDLSKMQKPTLGDYKNKLTWKAKAQAALVLRPDLIDAVSAYMHFLAGSGKSRDIGYERFFKNDPAGKRVYNSLVSDIGNAIIDKMLKTPNLKHKKKYTMSGSTPLLFVGAGDARYPYPATENWQKALGAHPLWADVYWSFTYNSKGKFEVGATIKIKVQDMYNFNPRSMDLATGTGDSVNGRFEITGSGRECINYGHAKRWITFSIDAAGIGSQQMNQSSPPRFTPPNPR